MHITLKWCSGLPGLRIVDYSIQGNHIHMICEVDDERSLSRAMQGLKVRIARRLNRLWERSGTVFADRYHREDLKTPSQVRNCIRYVLHNRFRHSLSASCANLNDPDPYSSGRWFTGWAEADLAVTAQDLADAPVEEPRTWLLSTGWKRNGLLSITDRPALVA